MSDDLILIEELNRKVVSALESLVERHDGGHISDGEFSVGVNAVFMAAGGLTSADVDVILLQACKESDSPPMPRTEVFKHQNNPRAYQILRQTPAGDTLIMTAEISGAERMTQGQVGYDAARSIVQSRGYKRFA